MKKVHLVRARGRLRGRSRGRARARARARVNVRGRVRGRVRGKGRGRKCTVRRVRASAKSWCARWASAMFLCALCRPVAWFIALG